MLCQWKPGAWVAVIVGLVVAISVSANQHAERAEVVTIEEGAR